MPVCPEENVMLAAWYEQPGPAHDVLRLGELDSPIPNDGEVLVRLSASGINPSDVKRRSGWLGGGEENTLVIPHVDGAGTIESVGRGVSADRIGQRVWVYNPTKDANAGTAAQFTAVPAAQARFLPDSISFAEGACIGVPLYTACNALLRDGPVQGQTILVAGGAGSVGNYAIQLAVLGGAKVITTVSNEEKAVCTRNLGADYVVNYRSDDVVDRVMDITNGQGVDRIVEVDFGANVSIDAAIIKPGGVIAAYSSTRVPEPVFPYYRFALKGVTLRLVQAFILPMTIREAFFEEITRYLERSELQHSVGARFPLKDIVTAHEAMEDGKVIGNIVVDIP